MIANVQIYIHWETGKEVQISPILPKELPLLIVANNVATKWLKRNLIN